MKKLECIDKTNRTVEREKLLDSFCLTRAANFDRTAFAKPTSVPLH